MRKQIIVLFMILTCCVAILCAGCTTKQEETANITTAVVATDKGEVQGVVKDDVAIFKGVPFAKAPVGELRFASPQPSEAWDKVLDCTEFKDAPTQVHDKDDKASYSEDCLTLNIWTPEDAVKKSDGQNLPVLVFIHGGAYATGSASKANYDGTAFANDGIIEVTVEYRLNSLGFLALEEMEKESGAIGNLGTLDQIAALQWLKNNIASFGGDPNNITISGLSAGSFSVSNLIMSEKAEGLFDKAIMESGSLFGQKILAPKFNGDKDQAIAVSEEFKKSLGAENLADLRKIDAQALADASAFSVDVTKPKDYCFFPVFDGSVIPEQPYKALSQGKYNDVPILAGFNTDEGSMFIPEDTSEESYIGFVNDIFEDNAQEVLARYPVDENHSPADRGRFIVKMAFQLGCHLFGDAYSDQDKDLYAYNFDYHVPMLDDKGLGVMHGLEMGFVFDTVPQSWDLPKDSDAFKDEIRSYWVSFIKTGNPNNGLETNPKWPAYKSDTKNIMKLNADSKVVSAPNQEDVYFIADLLWGN